jgi:hypothetical protein
MDETGADEETPVLKGTELYTEETAELSMVLELGYKPEELGMADDTPVLRGIDEAGAEEETPVLKGAELYTDELAIELELGNRPEELATTEDEAAVLRGIEDTGAEEETPVLKGTEEYTDEEAELSMVLELG